MDEEKREIRFMLRKNKYDKLAQEAEELDIPLASYAKVRILGGKVSWKNKIKK